MKPLSHIRSSMLFVTLVLPAALVLSGCLVTSVRPFYHAGDVVEVPDLLGTWRVDDTETWTLEPDGDAYLWRVDDGGEETLLETVFFEVQGRLFFDSQIHEDAFEGADDNLGIYSIRVHAVHAVDRLADGRLGVEVPDYERLDEALKSGDPDLEHYRDGDDRVVLTGSTTELQGFLAWCLARQDCFGGGSDERTEMTRVR